MLNVANHVDLNAAYGLKVPTGRACSNVIISYTIKYYQKHRPSCLIEAHESVDGWRPIN